MVDKESNTVSDMDLLLVSSELNAHQRECAERYKRIEERLVDGQSKFVRIENMVWGLYILLITSTLLPALIARVGG